MSGAQSLVYAADAMLLMHMPRFPLDACVQPKSLAVRLKNFIFQYFHGEPDALPVSV